MKIKLFFISLIFTGFSQAQTTAIPDANFEQELINLGHDDFMDGQVLTANINSITSLIVNNMNISDLTGIEDFVSLTRLWCRSNLLSSIDVSNSPNLTELDCSFNSIGSLDLSSNALLEDLGCIGNPLGSLDVTNNIELVTLACRLNQLTSLDISNNIKLEYIDCSLNPLDGLDISNNPLLRIIDVFTTGIESLDTSNSTELTQLYCEGNNISELNVSSSPNLSRLWCGVNNLTSLDVSNNTILQELRCSDNNITSLDLSNNTLRDLFCSGTQVSQIDISNSGFLDRFFCIQNPQLTTINIKNGNNVSMSLFDVSNSPNLTCIQVDNEIDANAGNGAYVSWLKDSSASYGEHCLDTFIPDDNFEQALIDLGHDTGVLDDYVLTSDIEPILSLNIENESIIDLTGIEDFRNLEQLRCRNNQIVDLDLSNNANLTFLRLEDNLLESLNLKNGNNGILTTMRAENNTLICVEVDDEAAANVGTGSYGSWQVDAGVLYSERCGGCPEIDLRGNEISIANGDDTPEESDHTDFGIVDFGSFVEFTFTIENLGVADLLLAGTPLITITNSTDFEVVEFPDATIAANGGTTSFTIRYTPSMVNTINTATITFMSDDCDNATYSFDVIGQSQEALDLEILSLDKTLSIYPNPNQGQFELKYSGQKKLKYLSVYDITGKQIQIISLKDFDAEQLFDLKLPTGFYVLRIQGSDERIIKKLIIN